MIWAFSMQVGSQQHSHATIRADFQSFQRNAECNDCLFQGLLTPRRVNMDNYVSPHAF